jgi:hypothetical protein
MNSTYHTTLQVTSAQLAFHCDMVMLPIYMVHWQSICWWCQAITDRDNLRENACCPSHGDLVLIHQDTHGKLAKPTHGPYQLIDVACQHVNCTIVVDLDHSHEMFNIRQLIWFKPCQINWGHDLSYHMPHLIIFLLVIIIHTSGLSLCTLTLLENPFTFFTNTHHPLQCYHQDCIFPCNKVQCLDVAPDLPVCHIIT